MITGEQFVERWLGAPYAHNGRALDGVDCYGLVAAWYREVEGAELPDWVRPDNSMKWVMETMTKETARRMYWVSDPTDGAIAVARRVSTCHHMGIYFKRRIVQVSSGTQVSAVPIAQATILFGGKIDFGFPI